MSHRLVPQGSILIQSQGIDIKGRMKLNEDEVRDDEVLDEH